MCLSRDCSSFGLELMLKIRTLLTVFTLILKAEACHYGKGRYISDAACGVRPITMHCASWPIRADCACRKEGLCRKRSVWERHRGPTIMYSIWKIMCFLNIKACQHILLHQIHKIMIFKIASYDPFKTFLTFNRCFWQKNMKHILEWKSCLIWIRREICTDQDLDSHSDGTHSLQGIYWWASYYVMLNFCKSVPMKKQTHFHLGWPEDEYILSKFSVSLNMHFTFALYHI